MATVTNKVKAPTQKEMFEAVIAMAKGEVTKITSEELVAFAEKKIEQLANKSGKTSEKKNIEQEEFIDILRSALMTAGAPIQCGALLKNNEIASFEWSDGNATSSQRVNAMLKKLIDRGEVQRLQDKKTVLFTLA